MSPASSPDQIARWLEAFEAARTSLPRAAWLDPRREDARAHFRALGFPSRRDEDWRYTDVRPVARETFRPARKPDSSTVEAAAALLATLPQLEAAARLVFVNGHPCPSLGTPYGGGANILFASLADVLAHDGAELEGRLARLVEGKGHAFAALNTALFTDGVVLRLPPRTTLEAPLHLVFLAVDLEEPTVILPRILVLAEAGSSASVVESWAGDATVPCLSNAVAEIWVEESARIDLLETQDQARTTYHFRTLRAHLARDAGFAATDISIGAALTRSDVHVRLDAEGAECRLDGLTLIEESQHADHLTNVQHTMPHGTSRQLYKGVLDDRASVAFSGKVHVHPHAQKTDAEQANHNLLLSNDAIADSKPQLEIYADDVKCTHGATVGQLDDEAVFYLRSRGVGERAARRMLLRAFASEVPSRVGPPGLRAHAEAALARRVPEEA